MTRHSDSSSPLSGVRDNRSVPVVSALVDGGLVAAARRHEALAVVDLTLAAQSTATGPVRRRLAEVAGYLGGAFVVCAATIFSATQWESLSPAHRVALLAGVAVLLALAGLVIAGIAGAGLAAIRAGREPVRRRLAGVLLTAAAGSAAAAVGVQVAQAEHPSYPDDGLLTFTVLAVVSLLGYLVSPTVVGQAGVAVGASTVVPLALDRAGADSAVATGLGLLALGALWLVATERGYWRETASARVLGSVLVLVGAQVPLFDLGDGRWVSYLLTAIVAGLAFAAYLVRPAWPHLAVGVLSLTLVLPEALLDWFGDSLGPAGALLVVGLSLLVAAVLGFRLRREVAQD